MFYTSEVFVVRLSWKSSLNKGFECGCLSHATIAEFFGAICMGCINV